MQIYGNLMIGIKKVLEVSSRTWRAVFFSAIEVEFKFNDIISLLANIILLMSLLVLIKRKEAKKIKI